jgi:hypothetical protein
VPSLRVDDQAYCWQALGKVAERWPSWNIEHVAIDPADPLQYSREVRRRWRRDDLIVVEHDCEPSLELLESYATCPEPLCSRLYEGRKAVANVAHLGCTKISLAAQEALPCPALASTEYTKLDVTITSFLSWWLGERPVHNHEEPLTHHHLYPAGSVHAA